MCGIAAIQDGPGAEITAATNALAHRGPDCSAITHRAGITLGHTRLAIQDPLARSDQPFQDGPVTIAYNGELFNAAAIRGLVEHAAPGRVWSTTGDTEVVAAALGTLPPQTALAAMDGMFAVAWVDQRHPGVLNLARDRHGEVPLHLHRAVPVMAASELKAFTAAGRRCRDSVFDVAPGHWWAVQPSGKTVIAEFARIMARPQWPADLEQAAQWIGGALAVAVERRLISDVPVCTLLSGGIDSAIITAELATRVPDLVAYTAVLDRKSKDLAAARLTADRLGVKLVEVPVEPPTADDLGRVISQIELPHKAQVEIGWPCLALAAAIAADGFKVTYSGEGSDELWASYGFAFHGVRASGWFGYRRDLITAQSRKNFPRVNKAFMSAGVEARLPFLDPDVVDLALSLPREAVTDGRHPKAILAAAYAGRLPDRVLRRPKLAFQDGLGIKPRIAQRIAAPAAFYQAEYRRRYA